MKKAVGFYWTLPVPWAQFTDLPKEPDVAAKRSQTIRYQCELVRRFAHNNDLELIHEEAFIENEPDRGGEFIRKPLEKLISLCRKENAVLICVDFLKVGNWRSHSSMRHILEQSSVKIEWLYPEPLILADFNFDPREHFDSWREKQTKWTMRKQERAEAALKRIEELRARGLSYTRIAEVLNTEGLLSPTSRKWTTSNLGKFCATSQG